LAKGQAVKLCMVRRNRKISAGARLIVANDSANIDKMPCGSASALQQKLIQIKAMTGISQNVRDRLGKRGVHQY
jgi:hypothetical protein